MQSLKTKPGELAPDDKRITRKEARDLLTALDKPEFGGLMDDYIKEISNPNNIKETNQFLKESEEKKDLPANVRLAKPKEGFCIRSEKYNIKRPSQRKKVFINIVSLEEVQEPISDNNNMWKLPYLLNQGRHDQDKKGKYCTTYDVVFNPKAIELANGNLAFKKFVCDTAIEGINNQILAKEEEKISKDFIIKKFNYKGIEVAYVNVHTLNKGEMDDRKEPNEFHKTQVMKEIAEKLSKDYTEDIFNQQKKYLSEKQFRIQSEQQEILREQKRIEQEDQEQTERKQKLISLQYQDYIRGLQEKENKTQKEFEEKLIPQNLSLLMNSEQRLRNYHDKIYKLSERADRNKRLFMDYNQKARNDKYYNYLSKRYTLNNKETNSTVAENREMNFQNKLGRNRLNSADDNNANYTNANNNNKNINEYLRNYGAYKDVFRQYDNYNKLLAEQNLRHKDYMNKQRTIEELKRIEEREKIYNYEKQEKTYENEKKKEYKEYLDRQIKEQFPIKLWKENYNERNFINDNNLFKNRNLYTSAPNFSLIKKSNFVEVNPYNAKRYDLGNSNLRYNTILNPMFNYNYNKYLFPGKITQDYAGINQERERERLIAQKYEQEINNNNANANVDNNINSNYNNQLQIEHIENNTN